MSLTAAQLEERRSFLGGTDAAAIAGVNPPRWAQPINVWEDKHGLSVPRPPSGAMAVGTLLEQTVAELATAATGMRWRRREAPVRHPDYPQLGGHLDRVAAGYDPNLRGVVSFEPGLEHALLECKVASSRDGWGPQGSLEVPLHYAVQVQHYLLVTRRPVAVLAVLLGFGDFRWYRLEANAELQAWLMDLLLRWWQRHGPPNGEPPEPDGSEQYGAMLRRRYATDDGEERVATPEQGLLLDSLRAARRVLAEATQAEAEAAQRLMDTMEGTAKLVAPGATVTWRQNKPSTKVQWEQLVLRLLADEGVATPTTKKAQAELVRDVARARGLVDEGPGARPFLVHFDSDEEAESA